MCVKDTYGSLVSLVFAREVINPKMDLLLCLLIKQNQNPRTKVRVRIEALSILNAERRVSWTD